MSAHPRSSSCLGECRLLASLEVRSPAIGNVVSEEFDHEHLFWSKLRIPLLIRKDFTNETFHIVAV